MGLSPPQPIPHGSGVSGAAPQGGDAPDGDAGGAPGQEKIDLNAADEATLDSLPGVGPVTAASIVAFRQANGPFADVEQLGEVRRDRPGPARAVARTGHRMTDTPRLDARLVPCAAAAWVATATGLHLGSSASVVLVTGAIAVAVLVVGVRLRGPCRWRTHAVVPVLLAVCAVVVGFGGLRGGMWFAEHTRWRRRRRTGDG